MELHPYSLDLGLTNVSQYDEADRPSLPSGPAGLLPSTAPASGPLQRLFRERGLDVYLAAALAGVDEADNVDGVESHAAPASTTFAAGADAPSFATPKAYGKALDRSCQLLEQKLAERDAAARPAGGKADGNGGTSAVATDPAAKVMRAALRVLTSTAEMRAELAMYRGLLLAG
jgi:hypothetical protein